VYNGYTDSQSVILAQGIDPDTFTKFLTLSPFIIDENAFKGEDLSKLFFFSHRDSENNYVYRWSDDPEDPKKNLVVKNQTYTSLHEKTAYEVDLINQRLSAIHDEMKAFEILVNSK